MTHPSSLDLEAFACEEPTRASGARARVATHVDECSACSAFVESLRGLVAAGPTSADADDAVARAMARVPRAVKSEQTRRLWLVTSSIAAPLAAAAVILLLARSQPLPLPSSTTTTAPPAPSAEGDRVLMAPMPGRVAQPEPETTFKGGVQLSVIRERGGQQERFSSMVRVRSGDRIRVEVALDREQAILGGVLADDGTYLELMPEGVRGAGTHFSERSAKIDAAPTRGTILIGSPEEVANARRTKAFVGGSVRTLRVEMEESP